MSVVKTKLGVGERCRLPKVSFCNIEGGRKREWGEREKERMGREGKRGERRERWKKESRKECM